MIEALLFVSIVAAVAILFYLCERGNRREAERVIVDLERELASQGEVMHLMLRDLEARGSRKDAWVSAREGHEG
jgi:hypothetical protein